MGGRTFSHKFGKKNYQNSVQEISSENTYTSRELQLQTAPLKQLYGCSWTQTEVAVKHSRPCLEVSVCLSFPRDRKIPRLKGFPFTSEPTLAPCRAPCLLPSASPAWLPSARPSWKPSPWNLGMQNHSSVHLLRSSQHPPATPGIGNVHCLQSLEMPHKIGSNSRMTGSVWWGKTSGISQSSL